MDYGEVYTLFMNGYANYGGDHRWFKVAPTAIFEVWPFGFVQDKTDMFRLDAIFRNGKLLKVVPYAPREELERTLVDSGFCGQRLPELPCGGGSERGWPS